MFCITFKRNSACKRVVQIVPACLLALFAGLAWAAPSSGTISSAPVLTQINKPNPDVLLIELYKDLAANRLRPAMQKADKLIEAYPNFQLAHLIRGDLLLMHTRPVHAFGAVINGSDEKLKNLRDEAMARVKSLRERPDPDLVPREVLQLRTDQKHVFLVDAKRSRLFVYANQAGQLKFVNDYYISQGKLGVNKFKEGDQKTPLGVYYITGRLPGARLPDFYGPGALPISYPNEWDKLNGRGGSGIWLHGTPSGNYSRPPLSSDGCVVLTNPDLNKLFESVEVGKTPVVISNHIEFVSSAKLIAERNLANKLVENWRRDLQDMDQSRLLTHYSKRFKTDNGDSLSTWFSSQRHPAAKGRAISVNFQDMTFFRYPGEKEMIVATFTQNAQIGKIKHTSRKRQYWNREGSQWKIISETTW